MFKILFSLDFDCTIFLNTFYLFLGVILGFSSEISEILDLLEVGELISGGISGILEFSPVA